MHMSSRKSRLPAPTTTLLTNPQTPFDSTRVNLSTRGNAPGPFPFAKSAAQPMCARTMLLASGCGSRDSMAHNNLKSSSCCLPSAPGINATSTTRNSPSVRVPVLSTPSTLSRPRVSRARAFFTNTCMSLSSLTKTQACTMGAAATRAHGQAPTSAVNPRTGSRVKTATKAAPSTTNGVYTEATRFTSSSVADLVLRASSTACCMRPWNESFARAVHSISPMPPTTTVPERTLLPTTFSTGIASPVTGASSTLKPLLLSTLPSTGITSPLRTTTTSPTISLSMAICSIEPLGLSTIACVAPD
mmetsp:Transcript_38625/g.74131  ORF Transcript_38625/g.74131 Transcript_38625/m.74131 type:complete len:302 (-) Transcript_38625:850-1755(-)